MTGFDVALGVLALAFALGITRAIRGPSVADRALAADLCLYTIVAAFAVLSVRTGYAALLDVVLIATLLGFLATIALAALIGRRGS